MPTYSLDTLKEAVAIQEQIENLQSRLNQILGGTTTTHAPKSNGSGKRSAATIAKMRASQQARWANKKSVSVATPEKKSGMSSDGRAKIAAAQRARWAKIKGTTTTPVKAPKKKGGLTPEGRAKLAAAMKARWAARKKGAPAPNASA